MAKKIDTGTLEIEKVIVHRIPKHKKNEYDIEAIYSEGESALTDGLRSFFKTKVIEGLDSVTAIKVIYDTTIDSNTPENVKMLLKKDKDFVELSKKIGGRLYDIQVGNNAGGILLVIKGKISGEATIIIMKLEMDEGARLTMNEETKSFDIEAVQDLMLTQKTKVFKVALFIEEEKFKGKYDGKIMDYQTNLRTKKEVSTFFMSKFLGCRPYLDPKILTRNFHQYSKEFFNTISDPYVRTKYTEHLNSYLQKPSETINPREFAEDYLESPEHKTNYLKYLTDKGLKIEAFGKDNKLIESTIQRITIEFQNGISIIGNKGVFKQNVVIEQTNDGLAKVEMISKIKKVA